MDTVARPYTFIEFGMYFLDRKNNISIFSPWFLGDFFLICSCRSEQYYTDFRQYGFLSWLLCVCLQSCTCNVVLDTYMQKAKKSYVDSRTRRNISNINTELQDVQRIMVQNIDDVLQRGQALSGMF